MKTAEIRRRFLDHFTNAGHTLVPSASLEAAPSKLTVSARAPDCGVALTTAVGATLASTTTVVLAVVLSPVSSVTVSSTA